MLARKLILKSLQPLDLWYHPASASGLHLYQHFLHCRLYLWVCICPGSLATSLKHCCSHSTFLAEELKPCLSATPPAVVAQGPPVVTQPWCTPWPGDWWKHWSRQVPAKPTLVLSALCRLCQECAAEVFADNSPEGPAVTLLKLNRLSGLFTSAQNNPKMPWINIYFPRPATRTQRQTFSKEDIRKSEGYLQGLCVLVLNNSMSVQKPITRVTGGAQQLL